MNKKASAIAMMLAVICYYCISIGYSAIRLGFYNINLIIIRELVPISITLIIAIVAGALFPSVRSFIPGKNSGNVAGIYMVTVRIIADVIIRQSISFLLYPFSLVWLGILFGCGFLYAFFYKQLSNDTGNEIITDTDKADKGIVRLQGIDLKTFTFHRDLMSELEKDAGIIGSHIATLFEYLIIYGIPVWFSKKDYYCYICAKGMYMVEKKLWKQPEIIFYHNSKVRYVVVEKKLTKWHLSIVHNETSATTYPVRLYGSIEYFLQNSSQVYALNPFIHFRGDYVVEYCKKHSIEIPSTWLKTPQQSQTTAENSYEAVFEVKL